MASPIEMGPRLSDHSMQKGCAEPLSDLLNTSPSDLILLQFQLFIILAYEGKKKKYGFIIYKLDLIIFHISFTTQ